MADSIFEVALAPPSPRKRSLEDEACPDSSPSLSTAPSSKARPISTENGIDRATSPSLSSSTSVSGDRIALLTPSNVGAGAASQKRRKLTPSEKEQQRLDKEAKAKERAEAKAKRDEEKRLEEEEKQKKRTEREERKRQKEFEVQQKRQEKEAKQQEKEHVKQKEEEEKQKKERSQLRLNAFFTKPKPSADAIQFGSPGKHGSTTDSGDVSWNAPPSPTKVSVLSDWDKTFLSFCLPQNATMAPMNAFLSDLDDLEKRQQELERQVGSGQSAPMSSSTLASLFHQDSIQNAKRSIFVSVSELIAHIQGSSELPVDLTDEESTFVHEQPLKLLRSLPIKYIHFEQDVRPPYYGTFTKYKSGQHARHLGRAPCARSLSELNYEYDSEAEWDEPEEGEDIGSEGEEELDSNEGDDDMEAFLDDENDSLRTRRTLVSSDMEPISSGLCWEDEECATCPAKGVNGDDRFRGYEIRFLLDPPPQTIDPYSTAYWQIELKHPYVPNGAITHLSMDKNGLMQPPSRIPLQARPNGGNSKIMEEFAGKSVAAKATAGTPKPSKRMIPPDYMEEFKKAIEGSDMTKLALVEALKKQFPCIPKDAINNTLSSIAARVGAKEAEKKWVLLK